MKTVSVVLPARNEEAFITSCLQSILENDFPKEELEIIVVDGTSSDKTLEKIKGFDWRGVDHLVLNNPARIVPAALNLGIRASKGRYIIRMDAHTMYDTQYIAQCVKLLDSGIAQNVGGPMRPKSLNAFGRAVARATSTPLGVGNAKFHFEWFEGFTDTVYLGAFDKRIFNKIGYFDEAFIRNQDDEFNLRMVRQGYKIYCTPSIKSSYFPRNSPFLLWRQYFQYGFWKLRVIQKHRTPASWRHLIPGGFVFVICLLLMAGLFFETALFLLLVLMGFYGTAIFLQTLKEKLKYPKQSVLWLPIIFPILHFSYGCGFLSAFLRFLYLKVGHIIWPKNAVA